MSKEIIRVLFICHGNICRSAMAKFILRDLAKKAGAEDLMEIDSAGTSDEEIRGGIGNPLYPPARRVLEAHRIPCGGHRARQITRADYGKYDLLIGMDRWNMRNLERLFPRDPEGKIHRMEEYGSFGGDVDDPWYTGEFEKVYEQLLDGCQGLLKMIMKKQP